MNILILGSSGLIGRMLYTYLSIHTTYKIYGLSRSSFFEPIFLPSKNISPFDFYNDQKKLVSTIDILKPDIIFNCAGITKHIDDINDGKRTLFMNSLLPHLLANYCEFSNIRLIQISTDCVFSGAKGYYSELDFPDGTDFYSTTKASGELNNNHLTVRISTVGPEISTTYGLYSWFMSQNNYCEGFRRAYFSGITSLEFAKIAATFIIPHKDLKGLYHISSYKISKYNLLRLFSHIFMKPIKIGSNYDISIDRSFDSCKFITKTGYRPKKMSLQLIEMKKFMEEFNLHD